MYYECGVICTKWRPGTKVVAKAFPLRFADPFLAMLEAKHWADCAVGGDVVWEQPTP